ncbi:MAG: dihydroneopterin triphosphate diphosphatase [Limnohabitans sp.]|nr:dihydroneopterin triphosphate diphosphatase [Limnohabitans sp.]
MEPVFKIPQSVLVVIYTPKLYTLILKRIDMQTWQSVTGSKNFLDETYHQTAAREVFEETGINDKQNGFRIDDWYLENIYDIYPHYLHRYEPGVYQNTEHVFGLQIAQPVPVILRPAEHTHHQWLPYQEAAQTVSSASNSEALLMLPRMIST